MNSEFIPLRLPLIKTNETMIQLFPNKKVFYIEQRPNIIVKFFIAPGTKDISYHKVANTILPENTPKIIDYYVEGDLVYFLMERINGMSLADFYGTNPKKIPMRIWDKVRFLVNILYQNGINYIDITGYNFIMDENEKIYIIDFEHCSHKKNYFLEEFLNGLNKWNPDFE